MVKMSGMKSRKCGVNLFHLIKVEVRFTLLVTVFVTF